MEDKKEIQDQSELSSRTQLRTRLMEVLQEAYPQFLWVSRQGPDTLRNDLNLLMHRFVDRLLSGFRSYLAAREPDREAALEEYLEAERKILKEFKAFHEVVLRTKLKVHMREVFLRVFPEFNKQPYNAFWDTIEDRILLAFENYKLARLTNKSGAENNYLRVELTILGDFLARIPHAMGALPSLARDNLTIQVREALEAADLSLSKSKENELMRSLEIAFTVYAGLSKIGYKDEAEESYRVREKGIISNLEYYLNKSENEKAKNQMKKHVIDMLETVNLDLPEYQRNNVADQFLWLFRDYLNAPEDKKEEVYSRGEERIIFSAFDPPKHKAQLKGGGAK